MSVRIADTIGRGIGIGIGYGNGNGNGDGDGDGDGSYGITRPVDPDRGPV